MHSSQGLKTRSSLADILADLDRAGLTFSPESGRGVVVDSYGVPSDAGLPGLVSYVLIGDGPDVCRRWREHLELRHASHAEPS